MLSFDTHTLESWNDLGIKEISCSIINKGCAGHKIKIEPGVEVDSTQFAKIGEISFYAKTEDISIFENARITGVGGKWLLKSEAINTRCGCGSSFSLKTGSPIQDKVEKMKLLMKQKRDGIHK